MKKNITFPASSLGYVRMHASGNLLAYSINSQLYVLNSSSNYSIINSYNHTSNIFDLAILSPYYVFIMDDTSIFQYGIEINMTVHLIPYSPVLQTRLDLLGSKWIFAYKNSTAADHNIDIF